MNAAVIVGPDGISYVPVVVAKSRPFAEACIAEWRARDGRDRYWMLREFNTINVPVDVIAAARARLERAGEKTGE